MLETCTQRVWAGRGAGATKYLLLNEITNLQQVARNYKDPYT